MDHSIASKIIINLESEVNVISISYRDKPIWPIIKYYLFYGLLKESTDTSKTKAVAYNPSFFEKLKNHTKNAFIFIPNEFNSYIERRKFKKAIGNASILFIDLPDILYVDTIDGKKYSRYILPYYEFMKKKHQLFFLNLSEKKTIHNKLFEPFNYNSSYYLSNKRIIKGYLKKNKKNNHDILNFKLIENVLKDEPYKNVISRSNLIDALEEITFYENLWIDILKDTNLKLIFLECYYGNLKYYGLFAACKQLNIKVVDIQHGMALHEMYQRWDVTPVKGYDYLCNYYWCWSKQEVDFIKKSRGNSKALWPILGGNLWLRKNIEEPIMNNYNEQVESVIAAGNYKKILLVTLQHSIPISTILLDAIKNSPKDWLWLVRFHPLDFKDPEYRSGYITELEKYSNVEFKYSTEANLYFLLKLAHVHLTHHSTSCIEALSFNVPTILFGRKFEIIFKEYIDAGLFFVADTSQDIIRLLTQVNSELSESRFDYFKINYSEEIAENALNELLN